MNQNLMFVCFFIDFLHNFIKKGFHATLHLFDRNETFSEEEKRERLEPFFVRDVANHEIQLRLSKSVSQTVFTDENGRFQATIIVDSLDGMNIKGHILTYTASDKDFNEQGDEGSIYLMKNQRGCSIISDIDDTIKISEVPNKKKLAVNTFKKDFKAVPSKF
jgi:phosphatidate phosphatase APP1